VFYSCSHTIGIMRIILLLTQTVRAGPVLSLLLLSKSYCGIDRGAINMRCILLLTQAVLLEPVRRLRHVFCCPLATHAARIMRRIVLLAQTVWMEPVLSLRLLLGLRTCGSGQRAAGRRARRGVLSHLAPAFLICVLARPQVGPRVCTARYGIDALPFGRVPEPVCGFLCFLSAPPPVASRFLLVSALRMVEHFCVASMCTLCTEVFRTIGYGAKSRRRLDVSSGKMNH